MLCLSWGNLTARILLRLRRLSTVEIRTGSLFCNIPGAELARDSHSAAYQRRLGRQWRSDWTRCVTAPEWRMMCAVNLKPAVAC